MILNSINLTWKKPKIQPIENCQPPRKTAVNKKNWLFWRLFELKKVITLQFAQIGVSREQQHGQARLLLLYPGHYLLRLTTVTEPHQEKSAVFFKLYPPEDQFEKKPFYSKSINLILTRFFAFVLIPNET